MSKAVAIIVAGGSGSRMQSETPKPLLPLADDAPLLAWSMRAFLSVSEISAVVVVVPASHRDAFTVVADYVPADRKETLYFVDGGATRMQSVGNGLEKARELAAEYVLIHDGARPFISKAVIESAVAAVKEKEAVTVAVPQVDSLKEVDSQGMVVSSPDRSAFVTVQTPQAFSLELVLKAHATGDAAATDDAVLVEAIQPVHIVAGEYRNFKVTTPNDYEYACYLSQRVTGIDSPS